MEVYKQIKQDIMILIIAIVIINLVFDYFRIRYDDSDNLHNGERSGLKVHVDHKTGIEYLSDGNSLIKRGK